MRVHARKSSSCSNLKSEAAALRFKPAAEGPVALLSVAGDGKTTESKTKEPNKQSALQSVPIISKLWEDAPQPLSSKQGLVPREAPIIGHSAVLNTHHSEVLVAKPDLKRAMNKRHSHTGVLDQKLHQNDVTFDIIPKAPTLALLTEIHPRSIMPKMPPLPKSLSLDRIPSIRHLHFPDGRSGALNYKSFHRPHVTGTESLRKRDELASVFRSLDGEFQKFRSRHRASRIGIVRSALLPFLKTYANHPSTSHLRPEDLDRRINILNRWWIGLFEMLNGRNGESILGNDRAAVLDAATAIMIRPEWDAPQFSSCTNVEKPLRLSLKSRSTTSVSSMGSEFLTDSVIHNIRTIFSQNLLTQIAFVIESMSHKNVSASLVAFCGKAIAYAFFYCNGVAEILVQLWTTPAKTLRRALAANVSKLQEAELEAASKRIEHRFPSCLQPLIFTSSPSMIRKLRRRSQVPITAAHIPWHGPWLARWVGKDTDLFFAFVKSYHNLTCRLLPDDPTPEEIICAPGYVLVQAHILTMLDATLQHTGGQPSIYQVRSPSPTTFDDILGEVDASANVLLPLNGGNRSMAENRLIMLLRDFLSGAATTATEKSRRIFAASFENLLKAATRQTSLFDQNACLTLCDFMEEAILIMARFHGSLTGIMSDFDWSFWLEVFKKMLESQNSMTEIRLYSFLYGLWSTLISNKNRKRDLCLGWLLCDDMFQSKFNHWCPMVRAYFMRLVCWRIGRHDGKTSELDREILVTLSSRLSSTWGQFLFLRESSEITGHICPSNAPCSPAPGRSFLIVRDDVPTASSGMFLSFDGIVSQPSRTQATAYERYSLSRNLSQSGGFPITGAPDEPSSPAKSGKRRWAAIRSLMPFAGLGGGRSRNQSPVSDIPHDEVRTDSLSHGKPRGVNRNKEPGPKQPKAKGSGSTDGNVGSVGKPYQSHSFRFSLEWTEKSHHPGKSASDPQRPRLPAIAQTYLESVVPCPNMDEPCEPTGTAHQVSRYVGMALAEWELVVNECQVFFERRRADGVPTDSQVETPTLKVEPYRKVN